MPSLALPAADLVAILVLTMAVYYPRHRRRDLVTAFLAVNAGVLAVTVALAGSAASVGLGLGLFGVLSIIRLRSSELAQHEIAYYFSALALGLLGGLGATSDTLSVSLMALIVAVLWIGDSPRLLTGDHHRTVVLDRAVADEAELTGALELLLRGRVHRAEVRKLDLVNDVTVVDVTYAPPAPRGGSAPVTPATASRPAVELSHR